MSTPALPKHHHFDVPGPPKERKVPKKLPKELPEKLPKELPRKLPERLPNKLLNMLDIVPQCPLSKQLIMPVSMPGFTVELEAPWLLALPLDGAHNVPLRLPNKLPIMPVVAPPWPFSQRNKPLTMLAT